MEVTMAGIRLFNVHYLWEDCVSMCLGALIVLTAWIVGDVGSQTVAANATIVGILVLALGAAEFLDLRRVRIVADRVTIHSLSKLIVRCGG
jgi:SPW repeat